MIDHLLHAADEPTMIALVGDRFYIPASDDTTAGWHSDYCFSVMVFDADNVPQPGFYLWVALPDLDEALSQLAECLAIWDSEGAPVYGQVPLYLDASINLPGYSISPMLAGHHGPFA